MVELVCRNDAEEICRYLMYDDLGPESVEALEEANALLAPIMNYIRDCKGTFPFWHEEVDRLDRTDRMGRQENPEAEQQQLSPPA